MSALFGFRAKWTSWNRGWDDWLIRWQTQWRWWARRWAFAVTACLAAWGVGVWLQTQSWQEFAQVQREVQALQAQLAAAPAVRRTLDAEAVADGLHLVPTADHQEQMWQHVQNTLAQHHIRLMALQPVPETWAAPLPSQAMAFRLQGRFEHWAGAWAALVRMGPVWSMDRLRVVPSTGKEGVDIEVVWRVWSRPAHAGPDAHRALWAGGLHTLPLTELVPNRSSVFDMPTLMVQHVVVAARANDLLSTVAAVGVLPPTVGVAALAAPDLVFSHEPERWPMLPLRVIGIWHQGDQAEAVLANATHWFRTQEGRQLSLEGHRVGHIGRDAIHVRDPDGRVQVFQMEAKIP